MVTICLISYIVSTIFELMLLIFGTIHIIKHPFKLKDYQINLILIVIFLCYLFNFFEKTVGQGTGGKWFYMIHPMGNLSPFIFTVTFIVLFIPKKLRRFYYATISTIMLGMAGAAIHNIITNIIKFGPYVYTCVIFDQVEHILIALLALYIIRNNVIEYNKSEQIFSFIFLLGAPTIALICNAIFDTDFFGLNLNGKHNIYGMVLTSNSYLSALIYFLCLTIIIIGGNHFIRFILKKRGEK